MKKHLLLTLALLSPLGMVTTTKGFLLAAAVAATNTDAPLKKLRIGEKHTLDGYSPEKYEAKIVGNKKAVTLSQTKDGKQFIVTAVKPCAKNDAVGVIVTKKDSTKAKKSKRLTNYLVAYKNLKAIPSKFEEGDHVLVARTKDDKDTMQRVKLDGEPGTVRVSPSKRYFSIKAQEDGETELHGHDDNGNKIVSKKVTVIEKNDN